MIKGIPIVLFDKTETGADEFGAPIYKETAEVVQNVLVSPSTTQEILDATSLFGKSAKYTLGIPKGDSHEWENKRVLFFGKTWRTFGFQLVGIDELVPTSWNGKVMVELIE